jgi:hypothetical protein
MCGCRKALDYSHAVEQGLAADGRNTLAVTQKPLPPLTPKPLGSEEGWSEQCLRKLNRPARWR